MNKRAFALIGLTAILGCAALLLGFASLFSSPDGWRKFSAWRMGGEYLGTDGVVLQEKRNNCGPAALTMVFDAHGISATVDEIEQQIELTEKGSSMLALKEMAELKGLKAEGWRFTLEDFLKAPMPAIVFVHADHFAVVDSVIASGEIVMRDPAVGRVRLPAKRLPRIWNGETLVFGKQ